MHDQQLIRLSATEMAQGVRNGKWTSEELVEAHIRRILKMNPLINAVVYPMFEEARRSAREADRKLASGEFSGPLHGVPITIKESLDAAGTPSTWGLPSRRDRLAAVDDPCVVSLKQAGAIVLGKTNVMQLLMGMESVNPVYGRTRNPFRTDERSSGGSSGGEAAIIAAGGSPLGFGTDIGGSIRTPAHFCGIHGLKPTPGRVPSGRPNGIMHVLPEAAGMASTGPMARHVQDLALAMQVISTPESLERAPIRSLTQGVQGLRVGFYTTDGILAPSLAIQRAVREAADRLAQQGAIVREFELPDPADALRLFYSLMSAGGADGIERTVGGDELTAQIAGIRRSFGLSGIKKNAAAWVLRLLGQKITGTHILPHLGARTAQELQDLATERDIYGERFEREMERQQVDVLISPPFLVPAVQHDLSLRMNYEGSYALIYNLLGMPAGVVSTTAVRDGETSDARADSKDRAVQATRMADRNSEGLPVGVQVAARPWREDLALTVMGFLETSYASNSLCQHFDQCP